MSENVFPDSLVCCGGELGVSRAFPEGDEECDPVGREPARVVGVRLENISAVVQEIRATSAKALDSMSSKKKSTCDNIHNIRTLEDVRTLGARRGISFTFPH